MTWTVDVAQLPLSEADPVLHVATIETQSSETLWYTLVVTQESGAHVSPFC
jgi:hypothetical protein